MIFCIEQFICDFAFDLSPSMNWSRTLREKWCPVSGEKKIQTKYVYFFSFRRVAR